MKFLLSALLLISSLTLLAQEADLPNDFLSKDFHKDRREKLRTSIPKNSVAVFFANPVRNRARDVDYAYHQDPDFYYLTGYKEPDAVLFIFKDKQVTANGKMYDEILFVQPRNAQREMWNDERGNRHRRSPKDTSRHRPSVRGSPSKRGQRDWFFREYRTNVLYRQGEASGHRTRTLRIIAGYVRTACWLVASTQARRDFAGADQFQP